MIDETPAAPDDEEVWDMAAARAKLAPIHDGSKKARQGRQTKIAKAVDRRAVDGRSLRATGRTEHLNFKARPDVKELLANHVGKGNVSRWIEEAIIAKARAEGAEIDDA